MKGFKKFLFIILAIILLVLTISIILLTIYPIHIAGVFQYLESIMVTNSVLVISVSAILAVFALVGLAGSNMDGEEMKTGVAIKHEKGNVYISKDTFESIILNVAKMYGSLRNIKVNVIISEMGTIANIYAYIMPDTIVPTVTAKLQENVKDAVLKQTTVEVKEVNVKIKGVYAQVEKKA